MEPFALTVINRVIARISFDPLIPHRERIAAIRILNALITELETAYALARKTSVESKHEDASSR
jgi:hypothetical protein